MRFFNMIIFSGILLGGCAYTNLNLPVVEPIPGVRGIDNPMRDSSRDKLMAGTTLFVNRTIMWRDILVYEGHCDLDELVQYQSSGNPGLTTYPVYRFEVQPGNIRGSPDTDGLYMISGFFKPGYEYTLLVFSLDGFGGLAFWPPQVSHFNVSESVRGVDYAYHPYVGRVSSDGMAHETFSNIVTLPYIHRPASSNTLNVNVDVNLLIQQCIRAIRVPVR